MSESREHTWQEGDRVVLADPGRWFQPLRGYGEAGRVATVQKTFTPHGATRPNVRVIFDMKRRPKWNSGVHILSPGDLRPAPK